MANKQKGNTETKGKHSAGGKKTTSLTTAEEKREGGGEKKGERNQRKIETDMKSSTFL